MINTSAKLLFVVFILNAFYFMLFKYLINFIGITCITVIDKVLLTKEVRQRGTD
jgi:hypothetical protein